MNVVRENSRMLFNVNIITIKNNNNKKTTKQRDDDPVPIAMSLRGWGVNRLIRLSDVRIYEVLL